MSTRTSDSRVFTLILLVATAIFLNYVDRGTIAIAAPLMKAELGLSATAFGLAVSAFFWVYAPIQLAIGWLCDRVSVYRLFAGGVALWAASTALTGFVGGLASLLALRVLLGLGESVAFPGSSKIIARHVPPAQRGMANAMLAAGLSFGPALGTLGGGLIMAAWGWRAMFFAFGLATLAWLIPWRVLVRSLPLEADSRAEPPFVLGAITGRWALWAMGIGHFFANYGFYFALAWLPLYLVQSRGYSIPQMTLLASIVYLMQGASALALGWLSDYWVRNGGSEPRVRRVMIALGHLGVAICIAGIALSASTAALAAWLALTGACFAAGTLNIYCIAQMFAGPRAAGTWVGIQNAIGNVAGIIGPVITGALIDATGNYAAGFALASGVSLIGAAWWAFVVPPIRQIDLDTPGELAPAGWAAS